MTKKTLIELMLENDAKWPEGAEFAAQDKDDIKVYFYGSKPFRKRGLYHWAGGDVFAESSVRISELCRNWHQTVVTREQYEAARHEPDNGGQFVDYSPMKLDGQLTENTVDMPRTLDSVIANIKECDDKIAHHDTQISAVRVDRDVLIDELNELLACVGMKAVTSSNIKPIGVLNGRLPEMVPPEKWPDYCDENGIVVDWDRVPEGSEVECVFNDTNFDYYVVGCRYKTGADSCKDYGPLTPKSYVSSLLDVHYKFRLIK